MRRITQAVLCIAFLVSLFTIARASEEKVRVLSLAGDVEITPRGQTKAVKGEPDMVLGTGDGIKTGDESYLEIAFDKKKENIVRVEANSDVVIKLDGSEKIELLDGELYVLLNNLKKGESFKISTPCAVCGARGTGWQMMTDGKTTEVAVFDNKVFVRGINKDGSLMEDTLWITEGFEGRVKRFKRPAKPVRIPEERLTKMRKVIVRPRALLRITDKQKTLFRKEPITADQIERREKIVGTVEKRDVLRNKMQDSARERTEDSRIQKKRRIIRKHRLPRPPNTP